MVNTIAKYDYEPFGKPIPLEDGKTRSKYIYKEQDNESKLADHGVRKYDYDLGRFLSIDKLWEKYYCWTPYQYSMNNPISLLDGNGKYFEYSNFTDEDTKRFNLELIIIMQSDKGKQLVEFAEKTEYPIKMQSGYIGIGKRGGVYPPFIDDGKIKEINVGIDYSIADYKTVIEELLHVKQYDDKVRNNENIDDLNKKEKEKVEKEAKAQKQEIIDEIPNNLPNQ